MKHCKLLCELFVLVCNQKALQLPFFLLFSLFPYCRYFWKDLQKFFLRVVCATSIRLLSLDTLVNGFLKATLIVKFCMCECDIPCALEKIVIAALITRSSKITWQTKTILSFFTIFITTTVYMAIRLSTIVAFLEGLLSIKLCDL